MRALLYKKGPRDRLCRIAGEVAPSRGSAAREATSMGAYPLTSRGRGTGFAGLQAQRPLEGQRSTRSDKRGGFNPRSDKRGGSMSELHKFIFEGLPVRGMIVRLTDSWQEILKRRQDWGSSSAFVARARYRQAFG